MKHISSAEERRAGEGYRVPFAMDVAGAWSWRLIVIAGAGWVVWKGLGHVSLLVIAMMVAMLLAALLSPTVMLLRQKGVRRGCHRRAGSAAASRRDYFADRSAAGARFRHDG